MTKGRWSQRSKTWIAWSLFALANLGAWVNAQARVDAIYSVPTNDEKLAVAAQFPTRTDQDLYGSPAATGYLRFSLPVELTGVRADFEMSRRANGTWVGEGTDGSLLSGLCEPSSKKWFSCRMEFQALAFDEIAREAILTERFGRGLGFEKRLAVARQFEGQPIGIIKVRIGRK